MLEQEQRMEKDAPLRRDIRALGNALGHAIQQHEGQRVFDIVEQLRKSCRRLRECAEMLNAVDGDERQRLQAEIAALDEEITRVVKSCDLETAIDVIRAFAMYFHLVNTAEQHHRTRRRRAHETAHNPTAQRGSFAALAEFCGATTSSPSCLNNCCSRSPLSWCLLRIPPRRPAAV